MEQLRDNVAANGHQVAKEVSETASGVYDYRPDLCELLTDPTIGKLIVPHRDRLARVEYEDIRQLLETQECQIEVLFPSDTTDEPEMEDELVDDGVAVIASMAARIYGRRNSTRRAESVRSYVEQVMHSEDA